ncbi:hypothetical protein P7K49_022674, partial [Saguinus oedipus]
LLGTAHPALPLSLPASLRPGLPGSWAHAQPRSCSAAPARTCWGLCGAGRPGPGQELA